MGFGFPGFFCSRSRREISFCLLVSLSLAILFPFPLLFFVGVFTLSFIRIFLRGKVHWKGRDVKTFKVNG